VCVCACTFVCGFARFCMRTYISVRMHIEYLYTGTYWHVYMTLFEVLYKFVQYIAIYRCRYACLRFFVSVCASVSVSAFMFMDILDFFMYNDLESTTRVALAVVL